MTLFMKRALAICALSLLLTGSAMAAGDDGGFGTYFTADPPSALTEDQGTDYSDESVSMIEPAAGEAVWIPPKEEEETVAPAMEILVGPDHPLVPGMDISPEVLESLD